MTISHILGDIQTVSRSLMFDVTNFAEPKDPEQNNWECTTIRILGIVVWQTGAAANRLD